MLDRARIDAVQGHADRCREHATQALALARREDRAVLMVRAAWIAGVLELGHGNIDGAVEQFERCERITAALDLANHGVDGFEVDRAEALLAVGREREARDAAARGSAHADTMHSPLALATAARCRAMLGDASSVDREFQLALALHELAEDDFELARTHLCYGERLRRERRCSDARRHLEAAVGLFEELQAAPWSARARQELQATGVTRHGRRDPSARDRLTPQELRVAEIIAAGATGREVAAQLFLSVKTVQAHLARAYSKLQVHNRAQLVAALAQMRAGTVTTPGESR